MVEGSGPGSILNAARLEQGLKLDAVADQLRLSEWLIEAIEADDYEALPQKVYLKGYLRAYARLLRLDETEIVKVYEQQHNEAAPDAFYQLQNEAMVIDGSRLRFQSIKIIALTGLILALLIWGYQHFLAYRENLALNAKAEVSEDLAEYKAQQDASANLEQDKEVTAAKTKKQKQSSKTKAAAKEDLAWLAGTSSEMNAEIRTNKTGLLQLSFDEDCWVSITDGENQRLAMGLMHAGKQLRLKGVKPIKLVLGNARAVAVKFNGAPVKTAHFRANQVGKLVLGEK